MLTAAQIRARLSERFELRPHDAPRDGAPAELFQVWEGELMRGLVGVIASVTEPFCSDCRRTRLTAEGAVRSCLFSHEETDLLGALRAGATDAELADRWRAAMWTKPAAHGMDRPGLGLEGFVQPDRPMSAIGG
jgi:GTP 3',8-cyclase